MNLAENKQKKVYALYKQLMAVLFTIVLAVPILFTISEMGLFRGEPKVEIQNTVQAPGARTLTVATDEAFSPDSYRNQNGELSGLYIEIMNEAANRMGVKIAYKTDAWLDCRQMLTDGKADILLGLEIFSNMEGTLRTSPICSDELCVFGKEPVNSAAELAGKRVALMARSVIEANYDLGCEYLEYYTSAEILQAVENGEADYAISYAAVSQKIIESEGLSLRPSLMIAKSYPAMAVQDSRPELKAKLNDALLSMSKDGTISRLEEKWLTTFTRNRSLEYLFRSNEVFYISFFCAAVILVCLSVFLHQYEKSQKEYIDSLLQIQKKLSETSEEAQRANAAKSVFLAHMSHDIRTPLNGIMGMAKRVRKDLGDPAAAEKDLDKIDTASGYLLALINDVLDMSAVESGKTKLENTPFDLKQEMNSIRTLMEEQAKNRDVTLQLDMSAVQHTRLIGSAMHLRRILTNLTSNAVKYNKPGGLVEVTAKETGFDGKAAQFVFTCRDTGIGMSEEFLQNKLYEPFSQENNHTARTTYQGTGVGMSIVAQFVRMMGGTITAQSQKGVGTTFTVLLSFAVNTAAPEEEIIQPEVSIRGMRVLLVEDNDLNREIAQSMLEDEGVQVTEAVNGQEAVDKFAASKPGTYEAILMDVMMPVLDGLQATKAIRALERPDAKTVAIIAMTANAFAEDKAKAIAAGMNEHLGKPIDFLKLKQALANYRKIDNFRQFTT